MKHIHFDLIMTVMQQERKQRARDRKVSLTENVHRRKHYRSFITEAVGEIDECDHDINNILSKYA